MRIFHQYATMRSTIIAGILILLTTVSACTKHYASSTTAAKTPAKNAPVTIGTLTPAALTDSLIGVWKVKRVEIPQSAVPGAAPEAKERIQATENEVKAQFLTLTATFKKDKTFISTMSSMSDVGTWKVTDKMEIETLSKTNGVISDFEVQSFTDGVLTLKYGATDLVVQLIFTRQ